MNVHVAEHLSDYKSRGRNLGRRDGRVSFPKSVDRVDWRRGREGGREGHGGHGEFKERYLVLALLYCNCSQKYIRVVDRPLLS